MNDAYDYIIKHFSVSGEFCRLLHNVLDYADNMNGCDQYEFLTTMLEGTIGLSDREIKKLCWH